MDSVCQWTNEKKYRVNKLLTRLIERCDQLDLYLEARRSAAKPAGLGLHHHAGDELSLHRQVQAHEVTAVRKKLKVLALFDAIAPTTLDQDLSAELKTEDWKTEANVLAALRELGHTTEHLAIFDNLDLLQQKLESFEPDVIFNLADQFKNNRAFDQHIVSFLAMHGVPFTGCGSTGLTLCKHKGISKKILGYHRIHTPDFVTIARGKRIARPTRLKFPILVKPLKEEASLGISQASFVETDEQFKERVAVHSREVRQRRHRRGIHRRPRTLRQHPRQSSPAGLSDSRTRLQGGAAR